MLSTGFPTRNSQKSIKSYKKWKWNQIDKLELLNYAESLNEKKLRWFYLQAPKKANVYMESI